MKLFAKQKQLIEALRRMGYRVDYNVNQLQPNTAYPFGYEGSFDNLTYGMKKIKCKNVIIVVEKYNSPEEIPDMLDATSERIINALTPLYDIVTLTRFDYTVFAASKMYALFLEFEVEWIDQ